MKAIASGVQIAIKSTYEDHQYINGYTCPALHMVTVQALTLEQIAALACGSVEIVDENGISMGRHDGFNVVSECAYTLTKQSEAEKEISALQEIRTQANALLSTALESGTITPEQGAALALGWADKTIYIAGDIRAYDGRLYRCAQGHVSQTDWTPNITPALWVNMGVSANDPEAIPEWIQPTGAHDAYPKGAVVAHDGKTWTSTADSNAWAPGVYGWVVA